jgi:hypothetical protein
MNRLTSIYSKGKFVRICLTRVCNLSGRKNRQHGKLKDLKIVGKIDFKKAYR